MALNVVGIVCALASEARHLGPTSKRSNAVGSLADGTLVAVTGMGRTAASKGARALIDAGASALASFGMAGGLDPSLAPGDVLVPAEVIDLEGARFNTDAGWCERLTQAVHAPSCTGPLLTASHAVASVDDKARLFRSTGAVAVDMESTSVANVARQDGLPFIAVRVIVDGAGDALPKAVTTAADREGHLQIGRLIGALARAPNELAPLIRLAGRYRLANRSLARIARTGALAPGSVDHSRVP